jgi:hypothetical protein
MQENEGLMIAQTVQDALDVLDLAISGSEEMPVPTPGD